MCSRIDMQTHTGQLGQGFDLLTSGSVHAEVLPWTICLPTLVLIAQTVFLLEHKETDATERPTPCRRLYSRCGKLDIHRSLKD